MSTRSPDRRGAAELRIRPMTGRDLEEVLRIERTSFTTPWSERTFRGLLERPNAVLLVAEEPRRASWIAEGYRGPGRRLVGYVAIWLARGEAELGDLAVEREARRSGVGTALVDAAAEAAVGRGASAIFLEVRESNLAARRLYERAGFESVGTRPGYYVRPVEDAVVMRRSLASGAGRPASR